jgi:hypothetical protein
VRSLFCDEKGFSFSDDSDGMRRCVMSKSNGGNFMRVKVQEIGAALHPSEVVVQVKTATGTENLIVDKRSIESNSLSIGSPLARGDNNLVLIELPRESMSGAWRVWVKENSLVQETKKVRAA